MKYDDGLMKIELELPFEVGDAVWYPHCTTQSRKVPCTMCDATGKLYKADGTEIGCWRCGGCGTVVDLVDEYVPLYAIVDEVSIEINDKGATVGAIEFKNRDWVYGRDKIYSSEEECMKACVELNQDKPSSETIMWSRG